MLVLIKDKRVGGKVIEEAKSCDANSFQPLRRASAFFTLLFGSTLMYVPLVLLYTYLPAHQTQHPTRHTKLGQIILLLNRPPPPPLRPAARHPKGVVRRRPQHERGQIDGEGDGESPIKSRRPSPRARGGHRGCN